MGRKQFRKHNISEQNQIRILKLKKYLIWSTIQWMKGYNPVNQIVGYIMSESDLYYQPQRREKHDHESRER